MLDKQVPGILYHRVGPVHSNELHDLTISPVQFERQVKWLAGHGYVGIKASDWLRWRNGSNDLPHKPILLTFDDAYAETADNAFPILRLHGFSATVFVVTDRMGGENTWDAANGYKHLPLMSEEKIRYWATQGIEFGAHSRTHPDLTGRSQTECLNEVRGSKNDLSALLGSQILSFAYPYGKFNDSVLNAVRAEFDLAFSVQEGMNSLRTDPYVLKRTYIGPNDSLIEFAISVRLGGLERIRRLRAKIRLRSRFKRIVRHLIPPRAGI